MNGINRIFFYGITPLKIGERKNSEEKINKTEKRNGMRKEKRRGVAK